MYISNFFARGELLELDAALSPRRFVDYDAVGYPNCSPGFFVTDPQLVFVASSPSGPTLGVVDRLYPIPVGAVFEFEGDGDDRTLTVRHDGRILVSFHAPVSTYVDVNFPDEPDMCDFFVWLQHRLPMPHARERLTAGSEEAYQPVSVADVPAAILDELRKRYAEPQRAYHSWTHIEALLSLLNDVRPELHDPRAVLYAILFHDAVYDPRAGDNEERSAALLEQLAADALQGWMLERVHQMILATKRHEVPADAPPAVHADIAHFLDMDLAILGAEEERFDAYERQIRREYAHVSDEAFSTGRARVLETFCRREYLFFTQWGRDRFEAPARANIARSLARLRSA